MNHVSQSERPNGIGIGAATLDRFLIVPEFPHHEGVTQALQTSEQGGGPVATALCTLSSLGIPTTLLDTQSDDAMGKSIFVDLERFGVCTQQIRVRPHCHSAHASILVRKSDGARHITFMPATCPELLPEEIEPALFQQTSLLHLNGRHENAARHAITLAKKADVCVSFDGGAGRFRESIRDLVLASDLRIVAKDFAFKFAGTDELQTSAASLLADSPQLLVITDGILGSHVWAQGETFHQPAFEANPLVDTTGCGDVFHGAFLYGWLQKWPIRETATFAAKLAAETAQGLGGRCALKAKRGV